MFLSLLKIIKKSRNDFESKPDIGIFGKGSLRICNLFYNYIYRFFFLGIICLWIFFPIIVLINFILSITFILTIIAWLPGILILRFAIF